MRGGLTRIGQGTNSALRKAILAAAASPRITRIVRRYGMRLGAARFVAGEELDECVPVLRTLNDKGLRANTTLLGEGITNHVEARQAAEAYERILQRLADERLDANVALKPTHLGLAIDEETAYTNVHDVVATASRLGIFIRLDMEDSPHVEATLRIYRRLKADGYDAVGVVLQAYLYRSEQDLQDLLPLRPNLRLVKGAYLEPPSVAFPDKGDVDRNYVRLIESALQAEGFTAIATHDEAVIEHVIDFAARKRIEAEGRFEFQMLYGVRPGLQLELRSRGYPVLVATPFGPEWYPYLMRRLAERPANLGFLLRNIVRG